MYVCMYVAGNWLLKEDSVGRRMPSRFHPNMSLGWEGNYRHTYIRTYIHTYISHAYTYTYRECIESYLKYGYIPMGATSTTNGQIPTIITHLVRTYTRVLRVLLQKRYYIHCQYIYIL